MPSLAFLNLSGPEILIILVVGLLVFGGNLPDVARGLARGLFQFRRSLQDLREKSGIDQELRRLRREAEMPAELRDARRMLEDPMRELGRDYGSEIERTRQELGDTTDQPPMEPSATPATSQPEEQQSAGDEPPAAGTSQLDEHLAGERDRDRGEAVQMPAPPTKSVFEQALERDQDTARRPSDET